jgi:hypothetical protein
MHSSYVQKLEPGAYRVTFNDGQVEIGVVCVSMEERLLMCRHFGGATSAQNIWGSVDRVEPIHHDVTLGEHREAEGAARSLAWERRMLLIDRDEDRESPSPRLRRESLDKRLEEIGLQDIRDRESFIRASRVVVCEGDRYVVLKSRGRALGLMRLKSTGAIKDRGAPAEHERSEHERRLADGRVVPVRACRVGG